eukprot:GHVR01189477.1.p1 GENE.GHVR01189477.1~~GHVR01189477.1.p1  ORF type:complete len:163 (+),score=19.89 GHVR01189477.1:359-847(+)
MQDDQRHAGPAISRSGSLDRPHSETGMAAAPFEAAAMSDLSGVRLLDDRSAVDDVDGFAAGKGFAVARRHGHETPGRTETDRGAGLDHHFDLVGGFGHDQHLRLRILVGDAGSGRAADHCQAHGHAEIECFHRCPAEVTAAPCWNSVEPVSARYGCFIALRK